MSCLGIDIWLYTVHAFVDNYTLIDLKYICYEAIAKKDLDVIKLYKTKFHDYSTI